MASKLSSSRGGNAYAALVRFIWGSRLKFVLAVVIGWLAAAAWRQAFPKEVPVEYEDVLLHESYRNLTYNCALKPEFPFHLAITGCERPGYGRYWGTTLLSVWLHQVNPYTVTMVWCRHKQKGFQPPSLWQTLERGGKIRIRFIPDELAESTTATYYTALTVPDWRGQSDIPVLVIEDDVLFAPDFHERIAVGLRQIYAMPNRKPFVLSVYNPGLPGPVMEKLDLYHKAAEPKFPFELRRGSVAWGYGVQAMYFSPDMQRLMKAHFEDCLHERKKPKGFQDMIIYQYIIEESTNCVSENSTCDVFSLRPSLVEHIGAASAVFGKNNSRFHHSEDFVMKVAFPMLDDHVIW